MTVIRTLLTLLGIACVAWPVSITAGEGESAVRQAPRTLDAAAAGVGVLVADAAFSDIDGKVGRLSEYRGKTVVVLARSTTCPLSKRYGPTQKSLSAQFEKDGIVCIVLGVGEADTVEMVRTSREKTGVSGRWIHDPGGELARALRVGTTTEAFVLDGARTLVYRGAIDDRYGFGYALAAARHHYLRDALASVAANAAPDVAATTAPGCAVAAGDALAAEELPTYHGSVARIVDRRCVSCHRPQQSAPFSLTSYKEVRGHRAMIADVVERRVMPPWFADAAHSVPMGNDLSLTERERATLLEWIAGDCPEGETSDAPLPIARATGWNIGRPDVVIDVPKTTDVPADGIMQYQYQTLTTSFDEDKWVRAFEVQPTHPQVVHHILVFCHYPASHPRMMEQPRDQNGVSGYFAAMVPGQNHLVFPRASGRFLPKGARLRFQIHYTPNGEAVQDRPRLGLVFTDGPPDHEVRSTGIHNTRFRIPPGAKRHAVRADHSFRQPARLLSLTPHMHLRGAGFRYELVLPDGERTRLLDVPRYDFNWQLNYRLRDPIDVPAGARIDCVAWFDNSADNPANPDPTRRVRFGEQTSEEMMIGYVEWIPLASEVPPATEEEDDE